MVLSAGRRDDSVRGAIRDKSEWWAQLQISLLGGVNPTENPSVVLAITPVTQPLRDPRLSRDHARAERRHCGARR